MEKQILFSFQKKTQREIQSQTIQELGEQAKVLSCWEYVVLI